MAKKAKAARYKDEILLSLKEARGPISLRKLLQTIFSKDELKNPKLDRLIARELRFLIKTKAVEKVSGSLYRLRPAKTKNHKTEERDEHEFMEDGEGTFAKPSHRLPTHLPRFQKGAPGQKEQKKKTTGYVGRVSKNPRGFAFVSLEKPPEGVKEDIFLNPEEAEELFTGDKVEISIDPRRTDKGYNGHLLNILERGLTKTVAKYFAGSGYGAPYAEVDTRDMQLKITLERDPAFKDLQDGAAIIVEVTQIPAGRLPPRGKIISVLADSLNATTDDPYIITKHKLREHFPDEVVRESETVPSEITKEEIKGRVDLRHLPFVTIDGADARDFDDAVCAERMQNGQTRLWVTVADVAHYVRPGSALDKEAYERGTSVYFPHRVLPMIPERLSNGICSLNPHEDRLVMVAEMDFDESGLKLRQKVYEAVFRSQHRCVYEELQKYYDAPKQYAEIYTRPVQSNLQALFPLYKALQKKRTERGSVDLNLPEAKVKVNRKTGEVDTIIRAERMDTHRLIEEFMIAANEAVSEIMEQHKQAFIFRVHETPDEEAARRFMDVARSLQVKLDETWVSELTPQSYQRIAAAIESSPSARVLNFLLLRSMKQAYYTDENLMHFGLASTAYTHFTSPIRRYPDLIVHRLLKAWIHRSKKEAVQAQGSVAQDLAEAAQHCSQRERLATDAERELIRMKQVRYAERHLGEEHEGVVTGITAKGAFVELQEVFVEGFVPIERFGPDFVFNEKLMLIKGARGGAIIRIGDIITVQISRTNPHLLQVELEPMKQKKKQAAPGAPPQNVLNGQAAEKPAKKEHRDFWKPEDFE